MTHLDKGRYFQKHPDKTEIEETLKKEIIKKSLSDNITCAVAEEISREKNITMQEVGMAIDILNVNITECQLGLFGYSPQKKIVQKAREVAPMLRDEIINALVNKRLPCIDAWKIAQKLNIPKMKVAAACETLQIKIKPCQLVAS
jgi:hypothetical protein